VDIGLLLNQNSTLSSEDENLLTGLRAGSEDAYEELIQRYQTPVYNLAFRLLDDSGDACDVVQEVFLKVFRGVNQFRGQSTVKTWIYRIAVNEAHNRRRWLFRHRPNSVGLEETGADDQLHVRPIEDAGPSPFQIAFNSERQALIEQALADINPTFREALVLRETEDCSYEEIAEILQISLGTVKSRILRGREALRKQLAGRVEPAPSFGWAPSR
jgi:RNA polymerase sigma-70 factor (ECF subfamily)